MDTYIDDISDLLSETTRAVSPNSKLPFLPTK